ncbi:DUF6361 family protein [Actinocatenispora sera]|uniref:DUF6361 family protein n=1 Tax=Actinocatenispora sera TaxID=390989 RepID=UPI0033CDB26A
MGWLDSSAAEQARMRECIRVLSQPESRDELGIGQVRDAFADLLFPGTSTLHTRARYLLLVPWCHREAERHGLTGDRFDRRVEKTERSLVAVLRAAGHTDGLIGRLAGPAVKVLPSTVYWSALERYGIRLGNAVSPETSATADELAERSRSPWSPTLPLAPEGFPQQVEGGLELAASEAAWLRERILATTDGTLLAHLVRKRGVPGTDAATPWHEHACHDAEDRIRDQLRHAELFSLCLHGAALLYNLLIAERYEAAGLIEVEQPVDGYRELLKQWEADCRETPALKNWQQQSMWSCVDAVNPRILANGRMRTFVDEWIAAIRATHGPPADNARLRELVGRRERQVKKTQSRLVSERLLRTWTGASGSARLTYRWGQVCRLLDDLRTDGEAPDAAA